MNRQTRRFLNLTSGIEHQRNSNWCVNHAIASMLEAHFALYYGDIQPLSNSWIMMLCKRNNADKSPNATGTKEDVALDQVCKYGCALEQDYPTWDDDDLFDNKFIEPDKSDWDNALKYKTTRKVKIDNIKQLLDAIEFNGGAVFTLRVYKEHLNVKNDGFINQPAKGSEPNGQHEIYVAGYDLDLERQMNGRIEKGFLILQESYGVTRGYKGYVYIPIRYFTEKITGHYSVDTYIKTAYTVETDKTKKYKDFHRKNIVIIPENNIKLVVGSNVAETNGGKVNLLKAPQIVEGRTMIPLRDVSNILNCSTNYDGKTKEIRIFSNEKQCHIYMTVNKIEASKEGILNNERYVTPITLTTQPIIINGSTYVGIRDIGTLFDMKVDFDNKTKTIYLKGIL